MQGWVMYPGKQEKASYPEVQGNATSAMPRRQVAATKRGQAPPHIRSSAGCRKSRLLPHLKSLVSLYFCGNCGCNFSMRDLRHRRCIEGVFCPHAPLRVSSKCERSRMGKLQPQLPFKNTAPRMYFRFTKSQKCGTLERDLPRNNNVEWSVRFWAF